MSSSWTRFGCLRVGIDQWSRFLKSFVFGRTCCGSGGSLRRKMGFLHFLEREGFEPETRNWFAFGEKFGGFERRERF